MVGMRERSCSAVVLTLLLVGVAADAFAGSVPVPGARPAVARLEVDPGGGGLHPIVNERGRVTLSVDGTGSLDPDGSSLAIEKPAGGTVRAAWFFAATTGFLNVQLGEPILLDGVEVPWNGSTPSGIESYNYYGDVTDLVRAKLDAAPAGPVAFHVREPSTSELDGEILAVVFDDPGVPAERTVTMLFGAQKTDGDTFRVDLARPVDTSDPNFRMDLSLGISYGCQALGGCGGDQFSVITVNDTLLTSAAGGQDDGMSANGALLTVGGVGDDRANPVDPTSPPVTVDYDDELYDLRPFVDDGDRSLIFTTVNPSNDDNIFFAALVMNPPATVTPIDDFTAALARRWAPVHYQDTSRGGKRSGEVGEYRDDFLAPIDFDDNWLSDDNFDNLDEDQDRPLRGTVYYSVVATERYWYVLYAFFHPWDSASPHENDLEGVVFAIEQDGSQFGVFRAAVTVAHNDFFSFVPPGSPLGAGAETIDGSVLFTPEGRPATYQEDNGHPIYMLNEDTEHGGATIDPSTGEIAYQFGGDDGVIYAPSDDDVCDPPTGGTDPEARYCLVDIFAPGGLWERRLDPDTFVDARKPGAFVGRDGNDHRANAPWAWDDHDDGGALRAGALALNPAFLFRKYFAGAGESGAYLSHPYRETDLPVLVINMAEGNSNVNGGLVDPDCDEGCGGDATSAGRALRREEVVAAVLGTRPEVVALSEVCGLSFDAIAADLDEAGYRGAFGENGDGGSNCRDGVGGPATGYGNAVFVRASGPVDVDDPVVVLGEDPDDQEQRGMQCVHYGPGLSRTACALHLTNGNDGGRREARRDQIEVAADLAETFVASGPTVVAGDFNLEASTTRSNCTFSALAPGCVLGLLADVLPARGTNGGVLHAFASAPHRAYLRAEVFGGDEVRIRDGADEPYGGRRWTDHDYLLQQFSSAGD